jgi:hypothetical protein
MARPRSTKSPGQVVRIRVEDATYDAACRRASLRGESVHAVLRRSIDAGLRVSVGNNLPHKQPQP